MSDSVVFKITNIDGHKHPQVFRDVTLGRVYEGTVTKKGE